MLQGVNPCLQCEKIIGYIKNGGVKFVSGDFVLDKGSPDRSVTIASKGEVRCFDKVIYATGVPRDVNELDSCLLESLLNEGVVVAHPYGGIFFDKNTRKVFGREGLSREIYVLGELGCGQNFFTSALEINARHAYECCQFLVW